MVSLLFVYGEHIVHVSSCTRSRSETGLKWVGSEMQKGPPCLHKIWKGIGISAVATSVAADNFVSFEVPAATAVHGHASLLVADPCVSVTLAYPITR